MVPRVLIAAHWSSVQLLRMLLMLAFSVKVLFDAESCIRAKVILLGQLAVHHVARARFLLSIEILPAEVAVLLHDLSATLPCSLSIYPLRQNLLPVCTLVVQLIQ